MGAVNTIYWKDGKLAGENTDGKGFLKSLKDGNVATEGKNAVILGAGGAARAIAVELAGAGMRNIMVINRNRDHAQLLVDIINKKTLATGNFMLWDGCVQIPEDTDILVNATSIGFLDDAKPDIQYKKLPKDLVVCDVVYNPEETKMVKEAKEAGVKLAVGGKGMLLWQGAAAYKLYTGLEMPTDEYQKFQKENEGK